MLVQGDLDTTDVASLLRGMQQERATGTLAVSDGTRQCSLYFLFGHLFHAVGNGQQGEAAVLDALGWHRGSFSFDARAKLPPEETITASTADLLAEWDRQRLLSTAAAIFDDTPPGTQPEPDPLAPIEAAAAATDHPAEAAGSAGAEPPAPTEMVAAAGAAERAGSEAPELPAAIPAETTAGERVAVPPAWSGRPEADREPPREPALAGMPAPPEVTPTIMSTSPAFPDAFAERITPPPSPPLADAASDPAARLVGAPDGPGLDVLLPLPNGVPQNSGLKSNFLNFPRMLRAISDDHLTGYIRLREDGRAVAHLLMREGDVLAAAHEVGGAVRGGSDAMSRMAQDIASGRGLVDVVALADPTTLAVSRLVVTTPLLTGLLARYVNFPSLLEYLGEERTTGAVVVITPDDRGVLLLDDGAILGGYTLERPDQVTEPDPVAALCASRQARIEVLRCQPRDIPPALDLAAVDRATAAAS
ncbi:MAG TPA: DUF4388 domain-containing protein [Verrucomicrobiae bacterium]|nr:DUF4388 domain-containing protein [Verrucomicrobiae bacterium]